MKIDEFKGIHNTVSPRDIPQNALQDAVNVDLTNAGGLIGRPSHTLAQAGAYTSAYTTNEGATYAVKAGRLGRIDEGLVFRDLVASSANPGFADYQRNLFTTDALQVINDTVINLRAVAPPTPIVSVVAGTKPAGRYSVLATATNSSGLESGASRVVTVELQAPGDILVTPIETGDQINIYMTECNGSVFFNMQTGFRMLSIHNSDPFPYNCDVIEYHESKLFVARQENIHSDAYSVVWTSAPLRFHLFGYDDAYFVVPGKITAMKSTPQGLVIGTDKEIYVYNDNSIALAAPYGVVPGRSMVKLPNGQVLIHSVCGVCKAVPFEEITHAKVSLPMGSVCSTALMDSNGISRYIAMHDGAGEAFNSY